MKNFEVSSSSKIIYIYYLHTHTHCILYILRSLKKALKRGENTPAPLIAGCMHTCSSPVQLLSAKCSPGLFGTLNLKRQPFCAPSTPRLSRGAFPCTQPAFPKPALFAGNGLHWPPIPPPPSPRTGRAGRHRGITSVVREGAGADPAGARLPHRAAGDAGGGARPLAGGGGPQHRNAANRGVVSLLVDWSRHRDD